MKGLQPIREEEEVGSSGERMVVKTGFQKNESGREVRPSLKGLNTWIRSLDLIL